MAELNSLVIHTAAPEEPALAGLLQLAQRAEQHLPVQALQLAAFDLGRKGAALKASVAAAMVRPWHLDSR